MCGVSLVHDCSVHDAFSETAMATSKIRLSGTAGGPFPSGRPYSRALLKPSAMMRHRELMMTAVIKYPLTA